MSAHAADFTFTVLNDGIVGGFDGATTAISGTDASIIELGLSNFLVNAGNFASGAFMDTIVLEIKANDGFRITSIGYTEQVEAGTGDGGFAFAAASMIANGTPKNVGTQLFGPTTSPGTTVTLSTPGYDFSGSLVDVVTLSVTNSIGGFNEASIEKTLAELTVGTTVVPLPPAVWLLGSALLGLLAVRRNGLTA